MALNWNVLGGVGLGIQKGAEELRAQKKAKEDSERLGLEKDRAAREKSEYEYQANKRKEQDDIFKSVTADLSAIDDADEATQAELMKKYLGNYNQVPDGYSAFDLGNGKISIRKDDDFSEVDFMEVSKPALKRAMMADAYFKMGRISPERYAETFRTMLDMDDKSFDRAVKQFNMNMAGKEYDLKKDGQAFDQKATNRGLDLKALGIGNDYKLGQAKLGLLKEQINKPVPVRPTKPDFQYAPDDTMYQIANGRAIPVVGPDGKPFKANNKFTAPMLRDYRNELGINPSDLYNLQNRSVLDAFDAGED